MATRPASHRASPLGQFSLFFCRLKMSSYKRKGTYVTPAPVFRRPTKRRKTTKRMFVPGRDRTGGYYGRYAGRNAEMKFFDFDHDDAVVATGGIVTDSINLIPQGTTESERNGRKCVIKSVACNFSVKMIEVDGIASPAVTETLRVIIFLDKQCNGAIAASSLLIDGNEIHAFRNLANQSRFTFLYDKVIPLSWATLTSEGSNLFSSAEMVKQFKFYKTCNIPLEFDSTTGAITEIRSNNIGFCLVSEAGTCAFSSKWRVRFSDGS